MKKNHAENQGPEGEGSPDLDAEGMSEAQPGLPGSMPKSGPGLRKSASQGPGARKPLSPETATESIDAQDGLSADEPPTENVMTEMVDNLPSQKAGEVAREDTEEVFVILPEEGAGQFPVVETVMVEGQPWEGGPTTTEVLKEVPSNVPLEDVALKKTNPLSMPRPGADRSSRMDADAEADLLGDKQEEAGVIDEIADIAADLNRDEPIDAGLDFPRSSSAKTEGIPRDRASGGSRRVRFLAIASSLAAAVLVGVFFWPDLKTVYERYAGGSHRGSGAGGHPVEALGKSPGAGQDPSGPEGAARSALRSRILLAMQVGLRAEAGKE